MHDHDSPLLRLIAPELPSSRADIWRDLERMHGWSECEGLPHSEAELDAELSALARGGLIAVEGGMVRLAERKQEAIESTKQGAFAWG